MKKFNIAEIENSFLNFFTPAVIIAVGYFLFNLIVWPLVFLEWVIFQLKIQIDSSLLRFIMPSISIILVCIIFYFIAIPRLKILEAEYKIETPNSLLIVSLLLGVTILFQVINVGIFEFSNIGVENAPLIAYSWFVLSFWELYNPTLLLLFLLYAVILSPLFSELIYRRTVIPLLEDRGLSPFHAVILSAFGYTFLNIPGFIVNPDYWSNIYLIISDLFIGFLLGIVYILTRNVFFPWLFSGLYHCYSLIIVFGSLFENSFLTSISLLLTVISALIAVGVIVYVIIKILEKDPHTKWIAIMKEDSAPRIKRGTIGFFIISIGILTLHGFVVRIGHELTTNIFPEYFMYILCFYVIAFSVPFWLTITTEYAQY
ncbi:MAG: CPBP family glutamic-type intramembrane protease [Candidatus Hodarchaeales archaeon]|jgi:hypothetical protein